MKPLSTAQLADRLYGSFSAIFQQWHAQGPNDSHLWEITADKTALQIIEQDLIDIGGFFSAADAIGERAELFLIAELIAYVRSDANVTPSHKKLDQDIAAIGDWLLTHPELRSQNREKIYAPLSYRIAQLASAQAIVSTDTLAVLRETFINIAYHFLLRDGNVTPEEDTRIKEFHDRLK